MELYYSDTFVLPLPPGHRFPMEKYALLRSALLASGDFTPDELHLPPAADDNTLSLAHCPQYIQRVSQGLLSADEQRAIGFPWTPAMVERSRRSAGATLAAARAALRDGVAANLAGGTHHAHYDRGEGFCVFNDAAVTARALQAAGLVRRVAIIDCDVHQGNGTAHILGRDPSVFTCSLHGARNFPFDKAQSHLDIELPDETGDTSYLAALDQALTQAIAAGPYDLCIYLAGADPYMDDRLGRLSLTKAGLLARDRQVLETFRKRHIPVVLAMAGGYARPIEDTVDIHAATIRLAKQFGRPASR
ncbi:MAG: histone deacetylase [Rhodocyclaceae bacterium]|nr:histone deacetylase [Rhodocyclaceae bacterium]